MRLVNLPTNYTQTIITGMNMDDVEDLPQPWIFAAFEQSGLTQTEIGHRIGESPQTINNWIARGRVPSSKWRKIAVFLGKSMDWVAWGVDKRPLSLAGASGPELDAIIAAAGYDPADLRRIWIKVSNLHPGVARLTPAQQADLLILVADTCGTDVHADQLSRLMRRFPLRDD